MVAQFDALTCTYGAFDNVTIREARVKVILTILQSTSLLFFRCREGPQIRLPFSHKSRPPPAPPVLAPETYPDHS
jgi:hypothetical protein